MGRNLVFGTWCSAQTAWFINQSKAEKGLSLKSNRCPAAPSDLLESGGAAATPAPPLGASLYGVVVWMLDILIGQSAATLQIKMSNGHATFKEPET